MPTRCRIEGTQVVGNPDRWHRIGLQHSINPAFILARGIARYRRQHEFVVGLKILDFVEDDQLAVAAPDKRLSDLVTARRIMFLRP